MRMRIGLQDKLGQENGGNPVLILMSFLYSFFPETNADNSDKCFRGSYVDEKEN